MVNENTAEKRPNMIINQVSIGIGAIDVSMNDNFGLSLESNINLSNKLDAAMAGRMKTTHRIMRVGTYVSKKSLAINHEMVQERWGIHPSVADNTVERITHHGVRIVCPHSLLRKRILTNNRILQYKRLQFNFFADALISRSESNRGNKYAEVFATYF